jgi:hypothetical protein
MSGGYNPQRVGYGEIRSRFATDVELTLTLTPTQLHALVGLLDHAGREAHATGSREMYQGLEYLVHRAVDVAVGRTGR